MSSSVSYSQLIHRLFSVNLFGGMKLGLENMLRLDAAFGNPSRAFPVVHVAGTNGKGSVTHKIAKGLQLSGSRVGQFISPHISSFRERISINGEMISQQDVEQLLEEIFFVVDREGIPATFFEITTLLGLLYFVREKVDCAVLEVGLGGRLDATNIVTPRLSVITSISLEHTEFLGHTVEEIALEKAGIIKPGVPVVLGPKLPKELFERIGRERKSPCHAVVETFETYEQENRAIARNSLELLGVPEACIVRGLASGLPCRMERVETLYGPVILDVAHNPDGVERLFTALRKQEPAIPFRVLFGLSKTKDVSACLDILVQHARAFHLVEAANGRGVSEERLEALLLERGVEEERVWLHYFISEAVQSALLEAKANGERLVVCGTFFIMGAVRAALGMREAVDPIDLNESGRSVGEGVRRY